MTPPRCLVCAQADMVERFTLVSPYLGSEACYTVRRCPRCRFVFAFGPIDAETLRRTYDDAFHSSGQQNAPVLPNGAFGPDSLRYPIVANSVARAAWLATLQPEGRLLDVGCGRGYSTKAAAAYYDAEGIEYSHQATEHARSLGVPVIEGDVLTHDFGDARFDVITLWDALASMPEPRPLVAKLAGLLVRGGLLVMTTPDPEALVARLSGRWWPHLVPPVNLGYYGPTALRALLEPAGFRIRMLRHDGKRVSLDFLLRKLLRVLRLRGFATRLPAVPHAWSVPINLRDICTVVAERTEEMN